MTNIALLTLHLIEAITGIILALLLRTLHRHFGQQEHLKYWAWSWLVMSSMLLIPLPILFVDHPERHLGLFIPLIVASAVVGNFQAPLVALATLGLRPAPPSKAARRLWRQVEASRRFSCSS